MEKEQLTEFKIQLALPAPTIEIAQEVANKAQVLINQSQSAPSRPAPEFDEFRQYIDQRITTQETLLQRIAQELGLDKHK
nr:MAG: hypothetical protein [Bacteriophage sp.]